MAKSSNPLEEVEDSEVNVRGSNLWYLDSGCSRHMTGDKTQFLSLVAHNGGCVTFGDNKKGEIIGIGNVGKSLTHSIENVMLVNGLKHNLLSISQLCDKGNLYYISQGWRCGVLF